MCLEGEREKEKLPVLRISTVIRFGLGTCATWHKMQRVEFRIGLSDQIADGCFVLEPFDGGVFEQQPLMVLVFVEDFGQFSIIIDFSPRADLPQERGILHSLLYVLLLGTGGLNINHAILNPFVQFSILQMKIGLDADELFALLQISSHSMSQIFIILLNDGQKAGTGTFDLLQLDLDHALLLLIGAQFSADLLNTLMTG